MIKRKGTILSLVLALALVVSSVTVFASSTYSPSGKSVKSVVITGVTKTSGVFDNQKQKGIVTVDVKDNNGNVIPSEYYDLSFSSTDDVVPGDYTLRVTAVGKGGITGSNYAEYTYTITEKAACPGNNYVLIYTITEAGCVTPGWGQYLCTNCGEVIEAPIAAHGHKIVKVGKTNSTCETYGCKAHYECSHCHQFFEQKKVTKKVGKKKVKQTVWKSCSTKKYRISKKKHAYKKTTIYLKKAATCKSAAVYYKTCKYCGKKGGTYKKGKKLAHSYQLDPATGKQKCVHCGKKKK